MKTCATLLSAFLLFSLAAAAQDLRIHFKGDSIRTIPVSTIDSLTVLPCVPDSLVVTAVRPTFDCMESTASPIFLWQTQLPAVRPTNLNYIVVVAEGKVGEDPDLTIASAKPLHRSARLTGERYEWPTTAPTLKEGVPYVWRVEAYDGTTRIATSNLLAFHVVLARFPFDLQEVFCCTNSLVVNGSFTPGIPLMWTPAYGTPLVRVDDGCNDSGYVSMRGTRVSGAAISQLLAPSSRIRQGHHYRVSFCMRWEKAARSTSYARLRAVAYTGTLPSVGTHPLPSAMVSNIGQTTRMTHATWVTTSLPVWRAPRDYDAVAFYVFSDAADSMAAASVDNICIVETTDSVSCDDVLYSDVGDPIIPADLDAYRDASVSERQEYREEQRGSVSDLYADLGNTALDTWYPLNDPCASIGGTVPSSVLNYNADDSLAAHGVQGGVTHLDSVLEHVSFDSTGSPPLPAITGDTTACQRDFIPDNTQPFGGRDIIYIHGLQAGHFCDFKNHVAGADRPWPAYRSEYYAGGYFKRVAEDNWREHITTFLTGHTNRYLVVCYNCTQRMDVAVHSVLTQIRDAMANGTGVVNPNGKDTSCFGRNAVIISHSTGGPVADIALSIANQTKTDAALRASYGNIGYISDRIRTHISLTGAQSGSRLATLAIAAQGDPTLTTLANTALAAVGCLDITEASLASTVLGSILVDLVPEVMRTRWSASINSTPVPVLAVTGGHPTAILGFAKHTFQPGHDDGVLTTSCTSSNPNIETIFLPTGYTRSGAFYRVYDMGIPDMRAHGYYLDQTLITAPTWIGAGMVMHLSPTGMVQPVAGTITSLHPHNRFNNHYSLIQSASDHIKGAHNYVAPWFLYDGTPGGFNWEESRAITDPFVYSSGLVSPLFATLQHETIRGSYLTIGFHLPWVRRKHGFPYWEIYLRYFTWTITIWERKYHNLLGYQTKGYAHYVYEYVLKP